MMIKMHSTD